MIKGVHAMFFTPQADEVRAFMRDKLGLPYVVIGGGWLIFHLADAEGELYQPKYSTQTAG